MLDLGGLVLFFGGAATFVRSWIGFQGIMEFEPPAQGSVVGAVSIANGYWRLQHIGSGLMLAGITLFVLAWWVARTTPAGAKIDPPLRLEP
jgi:hypothetical protein